MGTQPPAPRRGQVSSGGAPNRHQTRQAPAGASADAQQGSPVPPQQAQQQQQTQQQQQQQHTQQQLHQAPQQQQAQAQLTLAPSPHLIHQAPQPQQAQAQVQAQAQLPLALPAHGPPPAVCPLNDYDARGRALAYLDNLKSSLDKGSLQPHGYQQEYARMMAYLGIQ
jgi:hypothetical protein